MDIELQEKAKLPAKKPSARKTAKNITHHLSKTLSHKQMLAVMHALKHVSPKTIRTELKKGAEKKKVKEIKASALKPRKSKRAMQLAATSIKKQKLKQKNRIAWAKANAANAKNPRYEYLKTAYASTTSPHRAKVKKTSTESLMKILDQHMKVHNPKLTRKIVVAHQELVGRRHVNKDHNSITSFEYLHKLREPPKPKPTLAAATVQTPHVPSGPHPIGHDPLAKAVKKGWFR